MYKFEDDLKQYRSQFVEPTQVLEQPKAGEYNFANDLNAYRQRTMQLERETNINKQEAQQATAMQQEIMATQDQEDQFQIDLEAYNKAIQSGKYQEPMAEVEQGQITEGAKNILPGGYRITQEFGKINPGVEVFNKQGMNTGTDFGTPVGTDVALPDGNWQVVSAYNKARGKGFIGNAENSGYGNSVLVKNQQTGETLRFSHLSQVNVKPGQQLKGGQVFAKTGATGNVTGPHLDLEYRDQAGRLRDVMQSRYGNSLFGGQGGGNKNNDDKYKKNYRNKDKDDDYDDDIEEYILKKLVMTYKKYMKRKHD